MSEVKRYVPEYCESGGEVWAEMQEDSDGGWVRATDYDALRAENERLHLLCEDRFNEIAQLHAELAALRQPVADEREAFEGWARGKVGPLDKVTPCDGSAPWYIESNAKSAWLAWQARAALSAPAAGQPALTVWEGAMPESNGKSNFTAVLMRKGARLIDGISDGMQIARSEYPERVRYEADCVRWLIGELEGEKPCVIDYDTDEHSGYVASTAAGRAKDVHTEHCCKNHGCKYNDPACTVVYGGKAQSYPCEECEEEHQTAAGPDVSALLEAETEIRTFEDSNWHGSKGYHAGLLKAAGIVATLAAHKAGEVKP